MDILSQKSSRLDDAEIISKIVGGETALFEVLIRRHNAVLYKIARGYGFNHQDSEDLMQETHVAAYRNLSQFSFRSTYKTWLSKIMIHKCLYKLNYGYARREQSQTDISDEARPLLMDNSGPTPEQSALGREAASVIEFALEKLPLTYRSVFLLREVEGFSVAETAELLGITPVNVKVRMNRAKTMLQNEILQIYGAASIYDFHLMYCDAIVERVFKTINDNAND